MQPASSGSSTAFQVVFGVIVGGVAGIILVPLLALVAASGGPAIGIVLILFALIGIAVWVVYLVRGNTAWQYPSFARAFGIALAVGALGAGATCIGILNSLRVH